MYRDDHHQFKIIGICVAGVHREDIRNMVTAITKSAKRSGYKTLIFNPFSDFYNYTAFAKGEESIYRLINPELLDALIIFPEAIKNDTIVDTIISNAKENALPVISIDRVIDGCLSFTFKYSDTFENIVRHVFEHHKCRRVNFIAGIKGNDFSQTREDCYRKLLAENNIEFEEERLGYGDFWDQPTQKVVEDFIASKLPFPEAIICCNDTTAITACRVLRDHGYRIPDDVLVTGFDGIEHEKYVSPRLTTASPDIKSLGEAVIDTLESLLKGEDVPDVTEISYRIKYSQSCGCKPMDREAIGDKITELYNRINASEGHETYMFGYLAKTIECKTPEDIAHEVSRHADTYSWCCINSDFLDISPNPERYNEVYTKEMLALMRRRDQDITMNIRFNAEDMLPEFGEALIQHDRLMFSPLHFQDQVIGYMAVSVDNDDFIYQNMRRFLNSTNQIMESYKNRQRLEMANAELAEMHMRDPMTGIYNRRGFYKNVRALLQRNEDKSLDAVILSIDMDGLKFINDTYGHIEGDKAIKAVSKALEINLHSGDICSRFGGDEFIVFSLNSSEEYINGYIGAVDDFLDDFNAKSGAPYEVEISCGAVKAKLLSADQLDDFIKIADMRMYEQKRMHKNDDHDE